MCLWIWRGRSPSCLSGPGKADAHSAALLNNTDENRYLRTVCVREHVDTFHIAPADTRICCRTNQRCWQAGLSASTRPPAAESLNTAVQRVSISNAKLKTKVTACFFVPLLLICFHHLHPRSPLSCLNSWLIVKFLLRLPLFPPLPSCLPPGFTQPGTMWLWTLSNLGRWPLKDSASMCCLISLLHDKTGYIIITDLYKPASV